MAAAVHKLLHPHHDRPNHDASQNTQPPHQPQDSMSPQQMDHQRDHEKRALAQWEDRKRPLSPSQIDADPDRKMVGHSSRLLRQDDFELVKTLGTGACCWPPIHLPPADHGMQEPLRAYGSYVSRTPDKATRTRSLH